jgi:hypothetical protein
MSEIIIYTFDGTQTLPFRVGKIQVPLSMASTACPEQTTTYKSGAGEWVDLYQTSYSEAGHLW